MRISYSRKSKAITTMMTIICFFLAIILITDFQLRPIIQSIAINEGKRLYSVLIGNAVMEAVSDGEISYNNLVNIKYTTSGHISSVETNTTDISRLQAGVSLAVNNELSCLDNTTIEIPIGTLSGISFLNGKGETLEYDVISKGNTTVKIESIFRSAGINQTLHEIKITVVSEGIAVIPFYSTPFLIEESYIVCDTVIVGEIPESYTYVVGDNRETVSKLFDYR